MFEIKGKNLRATAEARQILTDEREGDKGEVMDRKREALGSLLSRGETTVLCLLRLFPRVHQRVCTEEGL